MFEIKDCENYSYAKELFTAYSKLKGAEQCFVSFGQELDNIVSIYPKGQILLAYFDDEPIGCIALKGITPELCELKRLYIKEEYRGKGYSKLMFEAILDRAKALGFEAATIKTLPEIMAVGYKMYLKYGFVEADEKENNAVVLTKEL